MIKDHPFLKAPRPKRGAFFYFFTTSKPLNLKKNSRKIPKKNSLTTPSIIDIWNPALKGGEIYKIAIKGFRKGGEERKSYT